MFLCLILATYPVFVSHPTPQHVNLTQTVIFTCNAIGYNVSYQWTIGSGSFPSKVTGINSNTLVIPDVRSSDDNTYTCVASNEGGNATSNAIKLTVIGMTMYDRKPVSSRNSCTWSSSLAINSVQPSDTLSSQNTYQWYFYNYMYTFRVSTCV